LGSAFLPRLNAVKSVHRHFACGRAPLHQAVSQKPGDLPDGQFFRNAVQPSRKKYSALRLL
jgi:hypothetical protein